jgi:hypothetical protein
VIDDSGLLFDELAGGENGEVGYTAYGVPCGQLLVFVRVDFKDDGVACHFLSRTCDLGCSGATGAAPVGPEVDKNRNAGALDDLVEERGVDLQGFIERWEWIFARAASTSVREVIGGETVFLAAAFAGSYDRHWVAPLPLFTD